MENYTYSSYPDSGDSSPGALEIDCENPSWDEAASNYKVKFMCSYGGKIHPRPHDNQLAYVGGDTKILAVDRNVRFSDIISKLSSLWDTDVCFKYQLPGEDLDALISVTNDEDLEHMMLEYDRLHRASTRPARLRLFLFPLNSTTLSSFGSNETKTDRQWFVDALNSVPIQSLDTSSPLATTKPRNPDFLFGLDKGFQQQPATKMQNPTPELALPPEVTLAEILTRSDSGNEDRQIIGGLVVSPVDIQKQIQGMQQLQMTTQEQALFQKRSEENIYYSQKIPEKISPMSSPSSMPLTMSIPAAYWRDRHITTAGGYSHAAAAAAAATGAEQPVYLISTSAGSSVYQEPNIRPVNSQASPGYYAMQTRVMPEVYREQQMYSVRAPSPPPPPPQLQQPKVGEYAGGGGGGGVVAMAEAGFAQVGYDNMGRQVIYTSTAGGVVPAYQTVTASSVDGRHGAALNQEGNKIVKASQSPV